MGWVSFYWYWHSIYLCVVSYFITFHCILALFTASLMKILRTSKRTSSVISLQCQRRNFRVKWAEKKKATTNTTNCTMTKRKEHHNQWQQQQQRRRKDQVTEWPFYKCILCNCKIGQLIQVFFCGYSGSRLTET